MHHPQSMTNKYGGNGMKTDPYYPHQNHMKVVNHLLYVWSGSVYHSMWVKATTISWQYHLVFSRYQRFQWTSHLWADKSWCHGMKTDQHPHPQHRKFINHLSCFKWMWEPFHVGLGPQPQCTVISFGAQQWPKTPSDLPNHGQQVWW